jgi:hypothetical protein
MHKNATKYNKTLNKWCKNKHEASKIMDTLETYQRAKSTQIKHHGENHNKMLPYNKNNA